MTEAESTIRYAIKSAMIDNAPIDNNKVNKIVDDVYNKITDTTMIDCFIEILQERATKLKG